VAVDRIDQDPIGRERGAKVGDQILVMHWRHSHRG
jgi:hypothetical protein